MSEIDDYRWLVSPVGRQCVATANELLATGRVLAAASRLRKELSPQRTHLAIEQAELRRRAGEKFAAAGRMFFTGVGLQQATGEAVADYKAKRFPAGEEVVDLCCGIGGDLLRLAARGPATGVDRDEICALLAGANCRALGLKEVVVRCGDVTALDMPPPSLVHIDPDRRPHGRRTTTPTLHKPGEAFLTKLIDGCQGGAIKLAPAANVPAHWRQRCELEWISDCGECKQLVVWFGLLAPQAGRRAATTLAGDGAAHTIVGKESEERAEPSVAAVIGRYLYEPDAAVIAAGLVGELAARYDLSATAAGIAYLTGERPIADAALSAFEVVEVLPLDAKKLKSALRARRVGRLHVKKRGVDIDPAELCRRLKCPGGDQATLIVTPHAGGTVAILARRIPSP